MPRILTDGESSDSPPPILKVTPPRLKIKPLKTKGIIYNKAIHLILHVTPPIIKVTPPIIKLKPQHLKVKPPIRRPPKILKITSPIR